MVSEITEHTVKPEDMEIGQRYRVDTVEGECVNKLGKTMVIVTDKGIRLPVSADSVVTKVLDHKRSEVATIARHVKSVARKGSLYLSQ